MHLAMAASSYGGLSTSYSAEDKRPAPSLNQEMLTKIVNINLLDKIANKKLADVICTSIM